MWIRATALGLVVAGSAVAAHARDGDILDGRDDVEFARALGREGYPDLAKTLLGAVRRSGRGAAEADLAERAIDLRAQFAAARLVADPASRFERLVAVVEGMESFASGAAGTPDAEQTRDCLQDAYASLADSVAAAVARAPGAAAAGALREKAVAFFLRAETAAKARIDAAKNVADPADEWWELSSAEFAYARLLYRHAFVLPAGSPDRASLCEAALAAFDEFELDAEGVSLLTVHAAIDAGVCLAEIGRSGEALASYDRAIAVREQFGPRDTRSGVFPVGDREIAALVCHATLQKMLLLRAMKRTGDVVSTGRDYFASVPRPLEAPAAPAVATEFGDALCAAGDRAGLAEFSRMLVAAGPDGAWGRMGRRLVSGTGGASGGDALELARDLLDEGRFEPALAICHRALRDAEGTAEEPDVGGEALLLIGWAYQKRGWMEEAALAYETGAERFPSSRRSAESIGRAIDCHRSAQSAGRRAYHEERIRALTDRLLDRHPDDPRAERVRIEKAGLLAGRGDQAGAVALYETVPATSPAYVDARLRMGICRMNEARTLETSGRKDEAAAAYGLAEAALREAVRAIGAARAATIDPAVLGALDEKEYSALTNLARVLMAPPVARFDDCAATVAALEARWGTSRERAIEIQDLRGRLYLAQGRFDEAEKWISDLGTRDGNAAAGPAGRLARLLDRRGRDAATATPGSAEADALWRRAARLYWASVAPQVDGAMPVDVEELTEVGNRLHVLGLQFNAVPASRASFVDWTPSVPLAPECWARAVRIYETVLAQSPDYRVAISLGRTYGFLGERVKAAAAYARLFGQESILDAKRPDRLDATVVKAKPELVFAFVEWGVSERLAFATDHDKARLARCLRSIFVPVLASLRPDGNRTWWTARWHLVSALVDGGNFMDARLSIEDLERNVSPDFDGDPDGYKPLFEKLREELRRR